MVVGEVPEQVEVLIRAAAELQIQHRAQPPQVRAVEPSALVRVVSEVPPDLVGAETHGHLVEGGKVQQAGQDRPQLRVALKGAVVGEVVHRRLAQDLHARGLLHLLEELLRHVDGGVEPEGIDVVRLDQVLHVLEELLLHEGNALVEVAQRSEPALGLLDRVVVRTGCTHVARVAVTLRLLRILRPAFQDARVDIRLQVAQVLLLLAPIGCAGRRRQHVVLERLVSLLRGLIVVVGLVKGVEALECQRAVDLESPHVIEHDVDHKAHALLVERCRERFHGPLGPPMAVDLEKVGCVIAHVTVGLNWRGDPNAVKAHPLDVGNLADDAFQCATTPAATRVVCPVCLQAAEGVVVLLRTTACKAIDHEEVDALASQCEVLLREDLLVGLEHLLPRLQAQEATLFRGFGVR
mmetsp:Transcript_27379/g.55341  ORF Transcript_27379/g.55341 Transcript_27379/m.55341 type:complete len:408 (-) Transcript_27379:163-1386(-)